MEKSELKLKKPWRLAVIGAYTIGAMYVGDKADVSHDYLIPLRDRVMRTQTAEGYSELQDLELVTIVNEENRRETYLSHNPIEDGERQLTPIKDNGYAVPESLLARIDDYFDRKAAELKEVKGYERLEEVQDRLGVIVSHYKIKARRFLDKIF